MPENEIDKLRSLVENLVLTHERRVERSDQAHLRSRLAEAVFIAMGGTHYVRFVWGGGWTSVPPEDLVTKEARFKSRAKGDHWSLEIVGPEAISDAIIHGFETTFADAIRRLEEILPTPPQPEDRTPVSISGIETTSYAERVLARLRRKFVENGIVDNATQVLFGIYRSDWRAFHLDRDIIDQIAREKRQIKLIPEIKKILEDAEVRTTLDYWLNLLCVESEALRIKELLDRILDGKLELSDEGEIRSLLKMWSVIPNPRDNTMTWSVLSEGCPTIIWQPVYFHQNPLQQLVVAIESSIGLFSADKPFIVIPIEIFGQPRLVVYLMRVERPQDALERTFWRGTWLGDIFSAFQTEFVARIQGQILAEPKADIWVPVISNLPLFLNLTWIARVEGETGVRDVFSVEQEREFVYQLGRQKESEIGEDREKLLSETLTRPEEPAAISLSSGGTLLILPVKKARLLVELEADHDKVAPHLYAIWHLVQEAVQLAQRQQEQTKRLIDFSTHDLNLFMDDLSSWTDEVRGMLLSTSGDRDFDSLRFASGAMVHVGWTPLQMWRDTIGFLLEGSSSLKSDYDISETLTWIHHANGARENKTIDFEQQGVAESLESIPNELKPLFHIIIYNVTHNAIRLAKIGVKVKVELTENAVEIVCTNDASQGDAANLQKLNEGVRLIKRGAVYAFERLAKGSGILGWAMMAQNRLGADGWDFFAEVSPHPANESRIQATISARLRW